MGLDTVELIMKTENKFNIEILTSEASNIITIKDIYNVVRKKLKQKNQDVENVEITINSIIAEQTGLDIEYIKPNKKITEDLGLD